MTHKAKESLRWLGILMVFMDRPSKVQIGFQYEFPKESGYKSAYAKKQHWKVIWRKKHD